MSSMLSLHSLSLSGSVAVVVAITISGITWCMMYTSTGKGLIAVALKNALGLYKSSPFFHSLGGIVFSGKAPKGIPHVSNFEKVSDRTYRVLGLNPGVATLQGTNTWLVTGIHTHEHILIDTGEDTTAAKYVKMLFDEVFPRTGTKRLSKILLTHGHADHQGGVTSLLSELKKRNMIPLPTVHKRCIDGGGHFPARGFSCEHIHDGAVFRVDNDTTVVAMYTPGHTDDHVSFIFPEDNAFLSGDCILGCGTSVFDSLYEYMNTLRDIRQLIVDTNAATTKQPSNNTLASSQNSIKDFDADAGDELLIAGSSKHNVKTNIDQRKSDTFGSCCVDWGNKGYPIHTIYPGHGPVISHGALAKIDEYIAHRNQREQQILDVLQRGSSKAVGQRQWLTSWDLVGLVYGKLPFAVKLTAQWNVLHHLEKLHIESRVEHSWPDMWSVPPKPTISASNGRS